ncbi:MAG: hypothetical protein WCO56_20670 [Verrucomicrobiota bacterium]
MNKYWFLLPVACLVGTCDTCCAAEREPRDSVPTERTSPAVPERAREVARKLEADRTELRELETAGKREEMEAVRRRIAELERTLRPDANVERAPAERRENARRPAAERQDREPGVRRPGGAAQLTPEELEERTKHVNQAIEHLRAAGLNEVADSLNRSLVPNLGNIPRLQPGHVERMPMLPRTDATTERVARMEAEIRELREMVQNLSRRGKIEGEPPR